MNRKIKQIDYHKWYHLESLKKYLVDYKIRTSIQKDDNDKEFTFVPFEFLWIKYTFITHPKTKRLKQVSPEAFTEVGFN